MFCEKCGYKNNDNARFCEKCGATLTAPNAQPQQPAPQQPAPAPAPAQPAAPKKPMDPKTKKIILFSAIGAGALAVILIVIFAIIVPVVKNAGAIDITKYYTVKFDGVTEGEKDQSVLDGKIEGKFTWDYAKFAKENNMSESKAESLLYNVESCMDIEYFDNKGEETYSRYFDSAFEGDTYKVTFTWPKKDATFRSDRVALQHIEHYENEAGVLFKHNDATKEFKLGEALKEKGVTVVKPMDANLLGYIKDNKLIVEDGEPSGKASVSIKPFETKFGDYTFRLQRDSLTVVVTDKDNNEIGGIDMEFSDRTYLKHGDVITLTYDSYDKSNMADKGILLTGDSISYTVTAPVPTTVAPTTVAPTTTAPATTAPATTVPATTVPATTVPAEFDAVFVNRDGGKEIYIYFDTDGKKVKYINGSTVMDGTFTGELEDAKIHWTTPEEADAAFTLPTGGKKATYTDSKGNKTEFEISAD